MTTTTHGSFILERRYNAAPERVFAAWSDPNAKRAWFAEGEGWDIQSYELDFREGGSEKSTFRFLKGEETFGEKTAFGNETVFNDIIPNERIIFTYSMSRNGVRFSVSLASVEQARPTKARASSSPSIARSSTAPTASKCASKAGRSCSAGSTNF